MSRIQLKYGNTIQDTDLSTVSRALIYAGYFATKTGMDCHVLVENHEIALIHPDPTNTDGKLYNYIEEYEVQHAAELLDKEAQEFLNKENHKQKGPRR
ncbi:hypothetical protein [Bifidobacterium callitrichidarum]|uniref:Uncharacterized protein n=1 Tax=Bifidobacterium callitrichidarum TaxID=2052941 RepID=A0A2U2NCC4_9BIFI|nr:hypothetical protein [Bifidobacterium callitrichidarum]PWG66738.1 hypothetical protein DF196_02210 [Bifidobacterium callitrichidarum]